MPVLSLVQSPTELTTAATDGVLAGVAVGCGLAFARRVRLHPWRAGLWLAVFASLAVGAAAGMLAHGLALRQSMHAALWMAIYASLALAIAGVAVGAVLDAWGPAAAARALAPASVAAGLCTAVAQATDRFEVLVAFEAAALLLAIGVYALLGGRRRLPGARVVTAGLLLTALAAAVQASSFTLVLGLPFDHNGLFHLIQIAALPLLARGLLAGFGAGPGRT